MTGSISPTLPTIGSPNASEDPHVRSSLVTIRDGLNAVLTSGNKLDGAQIDTTTIPNSALAGNISLNKLANGSSADIIVCDGSGDPQYETMTGDASIGPGGVVTLSANSVSSTQIVDANVTNAKIHASAVDNSKLNLSGTNAALATSVTLTSSYQTLASASVSNGTWLVFASAAIFTQASGPGATILNLNYNGADHATEQFSAATNSKIPWSVSLPIAITSGSAITLKAKDGSAATVQVQGADAASGLTTTRIAVVQIA